MNLTSKLSDISARLSSRAAGPHQEATKQSAEASGRDGSPEERWRDAFKYTVGVALAGVAAGGAFGLTQLAGLPAPTLAVPEGFLDGAVVLTSGMLGGVGGSFVGGGIDYLRSLRGRDE